MTTSIVSKKVLATFVNVVEGDDRYDKLLELFAVTASEMVQDYLRRRLEEESIVQYVRSFDFSPSRMEPDVQIIFLNKFPVATTPAPVIRYSALRKWDEAEPLVEGVDYSIDYEMGIVTIYEADKEFKNNPSGFRVSFTGGYKKIDSKWDYLDAPIGMMTATAMQASYFFEAKTKGSLGLGTAGGDNPQAAKATVRGDKEALIPEARSALKPYIRREGLLGRGT